MLRSVGKKAALLTLVCDILKGVVSVLLALVIGKINSNVDGAILVELAAFFVVLGHTFPIFFENTSTAHCIIKNANFHSFFCFFFENFYNIFKHFIFFEDVTLL